MGFPASQGQAVEPGWLSRILYWSSILVGHIPAIVLPIVMSRLPVETQVNLPTYLSVLTVVSGIAALGLGAAGLLAARGTTQVRRWIAVVGYLVVTIIAVAVPSALSSMAAGSTDQSMIARNVLVSSSISAFLAIGALLVFWSLVRNRRWWVLLAAVGLALLITVIDAVLTSTIGFGQMGWIYSSTIIQVVLIVLDFGSLGVLHVLGSVPIGSAFVAANRPIAGARRDGPQA